MSHPVYYKVLKSKQAAKYDIKELYNFQMPFHFDIKQVENIYFETF